MRAIVLTSPDAEPSCAEFPEPEPLPGGELLDLVGAGLHQVVRSIATGRHYGSGHDYPLIPGVDAVARTEDGRLVYTGWPRAPWGTMADRLATPFGLELPAAADPLAVAAGMNPGMSGWMPLVLRREERGSLGTVAVLGATGMAGRMAVQSAFALGAERVIAAGRDPQALSELREIGAEVVSLVDRDAARRQLETAVATAPSLVLDYVWGPVAELAFAALGRRGLEDDSADISYVQIGALAGAEASLPATLLRSRRIRVSGSGAGSMSTERLMAELPRIAELIADGTLEVPYTAYPFARIGEAWAHRGRGRAVVVPD